MRRPTLRPCVAAVLLGLAAGALAAPGVAATGTLAAGAEGDRRIQIGETVEDQELRTLDGKREHFLQKGLAANVFIFFRPEQERSLDTLRDMAACEKEFTGRSVRWVGVVSDSWPAETVRTFLKGVGSKMPILVDEGDALYGKLGIRLHPVIGIVDRKGKLAAFEPFRQINYCERIRIRVKWLLGDATEADVERADAPERTVTRSDDGVARRHFNFARTLHGIKQDEKALEELQKALAIAPSAAAHALRGQILAEQGKCGDALPAFEAALKIEPANPVALEGKKRCGR